MPSTPKPPTGRPTSSSPTTSKASRPGCASATTTEERHRLLRLVGLLVKDVLIAPEITIRHRIPLRDTHPASGKPSPNPARRVTSAHVIHCVGGLISPVLANLFTHYACTTERH
jgi:hypothetical protein